MKKITLLIVICISAVSLFYLSCSKKKESPDNPTPATIPVAAFTSNVTSISTGGTVTFTDQSTNTPTSWSWTFSGGTPSTSLQQNPVITYNTAGIYNAVLTATNSAGNNTVTKTNYITVITAVTPVTAFAANPTSVTTGGTVTFTDQSTNLPTSWAWTFAGGTPSTSTQQNPVITYNTAGIYNATLIAANSAGSNTLTKPNYITVTTGSGSILADFTADNANVVSYQDVHFTDHSTGNPVTWAWTFTNGTPSTSNLQNPTVKWALQGAFTVKLTVTNSTGGSNTKTMTSYILCAANLLFWKNFSGPNIKVYSCIIPGVPYDALNPTVNLRGTISAYSATAPNCGVINGWVSVIASGYLNYYCLEETTGRHWSLNNYHVTLGSCQNIGLTDTNHD